MKTLVIGDFNGLTRSLTVKLSKNGINVAVFNENKDKPRLQARFTNYTGDMAHVGKVFANYSPDVVLVTTFYDSNYSIGDLETLLTQSASHGIRRVVFLSSACVYGIQPDGDYLPSENDALAPAGKTGVAFTVAEKLCSYWEQLSSMQVTVLRLPMLYGPDGDDLTLNKWIDELLDGKSVTVSAYARFSFLHLDDMAEAVLQVVDAGFSPVYNVTSEAVVSACDLSKMISACDGLENTGLTLNPDEKPQYFAAGNELLRREYEWRELHDLQSELPGIVRSIAERRRENLKKKQKQLRNEDRFHGGSMNPVATLETLLLFALTVFLTHIQHGTPLIGNANFITLYLILIAVAMNLQQSALSLVLTCGLLVYQQVQNGYDVLTAIISSQTLLKAAEFCIIGISVSYVIHRLRTKIQFLEMEKLELQEEMKSVEQFSEDNLRTRRMFESQILEYEVSLPRIISMTARLDTLDPERIIPETINILAESVGVEDVAAYMIGSRGGRMRLSYSATAAARAMGQSPPLENYATMLTALEGDQVFINKALNPDLPAMASGVKINEKLAFVFVLWNIPYRKMSLDTSNLLMTITRLVSAALLRAYRYEDLTRGERYLPDTGILRREAFRGLCEVRGVGEPESGDILCCIPAAGRAPTALSKQVEPLMRENDYMGEGTDSLLLLLPGTSVDGFRHFEARLAEHGLSCKLLDASEVLSATGEAVPAKEAVPSAVVAPVREAATQPAASLVWEAVPPSAVSESHNPEQNSAAKKAVPRRPRPAAAGKSATSTGRLPHRQKQRSRTAVPTRKPLGLVPRISEIVGRMLSDSDGRRKHR